MTDQLDHTMIALPGGTQWIVQGHPNKVLSAIRNDHYVLDIVALLRPTEQHPTGEVAVLETPDRVWVRCWPQAQLRACEGPPSPEAALLLSGVPEMQLPANLKAAS